MTKRNFCLAKKSGLIVGTVLLVALTGCMTEQSNSRRDRVHRTRPAVQATVVIQDGYDYYPGYEVYYNSRRREYVYRDGRNWVRKPEPRGVSVEVLLASPRVRLDFHDAPSRHHRRVVRSYPRHWAPPAPNHDNNNNPRNDDDRDDRREERKHDGKSQDRRS